VRLQSARKSASQVLRTQGIRSMSLMFLIMLLLSLLLPSRAAAAANIYFAQTAQGANNGADCADAYAYNDGNNGINKSVNWVPGNTLHICGTISVGQGVNVITAQASGSSGNPITIKFEPGAIINSPYFGNGGNSGINLSGQSFITIDGGNTGNATGPGGDVPPVYWTGGLIQNYANGSSGQNNCPGIANTWAGACTNYYGGSNTSTIIQANGSNNITIENLGPCVVAVVTGGNFQNGAPGEACIQFSGSNVTITNNQFVWDGIGIDNTNYGNVTNTVISNNYFTEQGWALGCAGANVTNTNYQFYGNWLHNFDGWTQTGAHVNGIHCYDGSGGGIASFYLYNNAFDGNQGTSGWTTWVYLESNGPGDNWDNNTGTLYAFNNVLVDSVGLGNGMIQTGGGVNHMIAYNSFWGCQGNGCAAAGSGAVDKCLQIGGTGTNVIGNAFIHCGQFMTADPHSGQTPSIGTFDYNVYGTAQAGTPFWQLNGTSQSTFSGWQSACGCDAHSRSGNDNLTAALSGITNLGVISSGYIGMEWGQNLSGNATGLMAALGSGTTAGNTVTPSPRPGGSCSTQGSSSCWNVGAYNGSSGSAGPPPAPTDLIASVE